MPHEKLHRLSKRYKTYQGNASAEHLSAAHVFRREAVSAFEAALYNPFICLILQGRKEIHIGQKSVSLVPGDAFLVSHDLPVTAKILEASPEAPYRALVFALDLAILRSLYEQVGEVISEEATASALSATAADPAYIAPMMRYLELMDAPLDAKVLGPMIVKEIHFRLLMSPIGGMLRNLLSVDSHASRVAKAIIQIRNKFRDPLVVADLAEFAGMSPSSFHEHFKSVTGPTHFSRDYSRKFGCSPKHHLAQAK